VTFDTSALQTLILDDAGNSLDYSARSGSILVPAAAVPEPSTLLVVTVGAIGALIARLLGLPLVARGDNPDRRSPCGAE
jgi:hypothetical protein